MTRSIFVCKKTTAQPTERFAGYAFYSISLTGADHEGIVHKISSHLRDLNINFQSLDTDIVNAPETGTPLFTMHAEIAVPANISFDALSKDLARLADQEAVEIDLLSSSFIEGEMIRL